MVFTFLCLSLWCSMSASATGREVPSSVGRYDSLSKHNQHSSIVELYGQEDQKLVAGLLKKFDKFERTKEGFFFPFEIPAIYEVLHNITSTSRVFEVGFGTLLPAFLCLLKGAKQVTVVDKRGDLVLTCGAFLVEFCKDFSGSDERFFALTRKVRIVQEDWQKLSESLSDNSQDVVISRNVIHLLPKNTQERMAGEFNRILSPGGFCFISVDSSYIPGIQEKDAKRFAGYRTWNIENKQTKTVVYTVPLEEAKPENPLEVLVFSGQEKTKIHGFEDAERDAALTAGIENQEFRDEIEGKSRKLVWQIAEKWKYSCETIQRTSFAQLLTCTFAQKCVQINDEKMHPAGYAFSYPEDVDTDYQQLCIAGMGYPKLVAFFTKKTIQTQSSENIVSK